MRLDQGRVTVELRCQFTYYIAQEAEREREREMKHIAPIPTTRLVVAKLCRFIRSGGIIVVIVGCLGHGASTSAATDNAGPKDDGFIGDPKVCQAFKEFVEYQRTQYDELPADGFIERNEKPWAGVSTVPELGTGNSVIGDLHWIGYSYDGVDYQEIPTQLFTADLFHDQKKRVVLITTSYGNKINHRNSSVTILKPGLVLDTVKQDGGNGIDIYGPSPLSVDFKSGIHFGIGDTYDFLQNEVRYNLKDMSLGNIPVTLSAISYYEFWKSRVRYARLIVPIAYNSEGVWLAREHRKMIITYSDIIYKGLSEKESIRRILLFSHFLVDGDDDGYASAQKAYLFSGRVYFLYGLPMYAGASGVYRITSDWKIEILCEHSF